MNRNKSDWVELIFNRFESNRIYNVFRIGSEWNCLVWIQTPEWFGFVQKKFQSETIAKDLTLVNSALTLLLPTLCDFGPTFGDKNRDLKGYIENDLSLLNLFWVWKKIGNHEARFFYIKFPSSRGFLAHVVFCVEDRRSPLPPIVALHRPRFICSSRSAYRECRSYPRYSRVSISSTMVS